MNVLFDLLSWPFAWILAILYMAFKNYGLTIIVFTIIVKAFMLPIGVKQQKSSLMQVRFQPKMKELQEKYKTNKVKLNEEMQKLYQEEGYNPLGGCLPMLIQLPIVLILYNIITRPLTNICGLSASKITAIKSVLDVKATTSQLELAELIRNNAGKLKDVLPDGFINIDFNFLGLNLSQKPRLAFELLIIIPILSAATGFLMSYITQKYSAVQAAGNMKVLMFLSPLMSLYFSFIFPAGIGLYWVMSNITAALQSLYLGHKYNPKEYAEKLKQEEEERKRLEKQRIKDKRAAKYGNKLLDVKEDPDKDIETKEENE